ncbi:MAG: AI-2E family transporter [Bacteroidota bacterium]|nr:AI-2E family transporter [Bacteroidota bacterium]
MQRINSDKLRQISFLVLLVFLGIFLFLQLNAFLPSLLGAVTFYILMRGSMRYFTEKKKWSKPATALLLMLISFIVVLIPVSVFINILYEKIDYTIQNANHVIDALKINIDHLEKNYHIQIISDKNLQQAEATVTEAVPQLLGATFNSLVTVVILYFILYFLLINSHEIEKWIYRNIPLKEENVQLIGSEIKTLVTSNALGIPITATLQGIIGTIAYWFLGVQDIPFWFVATCLTAVVPMVGSSLAFIPVAIVLFAEGSSWKGVVMLLYGFGIMYTLDSVFRIAIQKRMGNVHPLITTFGVIVGLKLFGFMGLIFGPILLSMFILLVRIYINEFAE